MPFMPGNSFFNNFQSGGPVGGISPANVAAGMPAAVAANPVLPPLAPGQTGTSQTSATNQATAQTQAGSSRAVVPGNWLGTANSGLTELLHQYDTSGAAFDTTAADQAAAEQQARDLSTGMSAASNAAATYAAKTRQAGGSGAASGLIKAEGQISAMDAAGKAKVEQAKYDVAQREAAATHAGQIAQVLANLRDSYLNALIGRDTTGSGATASTGSTSQIGISGGGGGGGGAGNWYSLTPTPGAQGNLPAQAFNATTGQTSRPVSDTNLTGPWNSGSYGG